MKINHLIGFGFVVLLTSCVTVHQPIDYSTLGIDPFEGPQPIAVLIDTNHWLMVIGSDTPRITIYEDGQIIYLKMEKDKKPVYYHVQVSAEELSEIKKKLASFGDYKELYPSYQLISITCQPWTKIYLSLDDNAFVTSVYSLAHDQYYRERGYLLAEPPKAIADLYSYLTTLDFADAKPWSPPFVEVMLSSGGGRSVKWPEKWPDFDSPNVLKRGNAYSIFLPGEELPKLESLFLTSEGIRRARINGKTWYTGWRYTFPNEPVWFKAFREHRRLKLMPITTQLDPNSNILIPELLGDLEKTRIIDFESKYRGLGTSVDYQARGIQASVYIYTLGSQDIPDGTESNIVRKQFEGIKPDIHESARRGMSAFHEWSLSPTFLDPETKKIPVLTATRSGFDVGKYKTFRFYAFAKKNRIFKIRISNLEKKDDKLAIQRANFLKSVEEWLR